MEIKYRSIDEQIKLIKAKNILIKDEEKAKKVLLREGYYNLISGYKDIFINMKLSKKTGIETCDEETYFEEIYAVYKFDRDLRNLMFKYISIIETYIKSYISEVFSKKYGTQNYLVEGNFNIGPKRKARYDKFISIIKDSINRNINNYPEIKKCYKENEDIPFWLLNIFITFGSIVKFYTFMKIEDKEEVAKILEMDFKEVQSYLKVLNIIRNVAAHNNVLFNLKFNIPYDYMKNDTYHELLGINKENNIYVSGINDMTSVIIILRRFLENKEYKHLALELIEIIDEIKEELDKNSFENLLEEIGLPLEYKRLENL